MYLIPHVFVRINRDGTEGGQDSAGDLGHAVIVVSRGEAQNAGWAGGGKRVFSGSRKGRNQNSLSSLKQKTTRRPFFLLHPLSFILPVQMQAGLNKDVFFYRSVEVGGDFSQTHGGVAPDRTLLISGLQPGEVSHQLLVQVALVQFRSQQQHGLPGQTRKIKDWMFDRIQGNVTFFSVHVQL